jgi:hypothetical protein
MARQYFIAHSRGHAAISEQKVNAMPANYQINRVRHGCASAHQKSSAIGRMTRRDCGQLGFLYMFEERL